MCAHGVHPTLRYFEVFPRQPMGSVASMQGDVRTGRSQQVCQRARLRGGNNRIVSTGSDQDRNAVQRGQCLRDQRYHRSQQQSPAQAAWVKQEQCCGDVGPVRIAQGDGWGFTQVVRFPRSSEKFTQFVSPEPEVLDIEDTLCQPAEEPRHTIFENLPPRAEERSPGGQRFTQREQIVLIATGAMEQQQWGGPRPGSGPEPVNEAETGILHPACPTGACGNRSGGSTRSISALLASYIGGSLRRVPSSVAGSSM